MMNTQVANTELLKLITESHLDERDTVEIIRIFPILWEKRQVEILNDWPQISNQIRLHREEIEKEKEILLIKMIDDIESDLETYSKQVTGKTAKMKLNELSKTNNTLYS